MGLSMVYDALPVPGVRKPFYRGDGPNTYQSTGAVTSFFVPKGDAGTVAGDWIFIHIFGTNTTGIACAGFTVINDTGPYGALLYKQATDADMTALGYTITGINSEPVSVSTVTVVAPGGIDVIGPATISNSATSIVLPSITLSGANDLVLAFVGNENGFGGASFNIAQPNATPNGWTQQAAIGASSTFPAMIVSANTYYGSGATGTVTFTASSATFWSGFLVAFAGGQGQAREDVRTEFSLGTLGWTDVTGDVALQSDVTTGRGKPDEQTSMTPSTLAFLLNNPDGRYSDVNPTGPFYGNLGRNTPVRVSVPEGASYVRFRDDTVSFVSGPTGGTSVNDTDIQIDVTLDNWRAAQQIAGKWGSAPNQEWVLLLNDFGSLTLNISTTGSNTSQFFSQAPIPIPPGRRAALRFSFHSANGLCELWYAPGGNLPGCQWVQLDNLILASGQLHAGSAATVLGNCNNSVFAGTPSIGGKLHAAQMYGSTIARRGSASSILKAVNGGTITWSTNPSTAAGLKVLVWLFTANETITSVVDNGTTPTTFTLDGTSTVVSGGTTYQVFLYRGDSVTMPSSGSYTVTITGTGGTTIEAMGISYNGVKAGAPTATATNSSPGSRQPSTGGLSTTAIAEGLAATAFINASAMAPEPFSMATPWWNPQLFDTNPGVSRKCGMADACPLGNQTIAGPTWQLPDSVPWAALSAIYEPFSTPQLNWQVDWTNQPPGTFCIQDFTDVTWCVNGNAIVTDRQYLFWGELSAFPTSWNERGTQVQVNMQAGGLSRRLSQSASQQPLQSVLRRAFGGTAGVASKLANLIAYWPCEDGNSQGFSFATSTSPPYIAAGIPGVPNGTFSGFPQFAQNSNFQASLALPAFNNSAWTFSIPRNGPNDTTNYMRFLLQVPQGGEQAFASGTNTPISLCELHTTGTVARVMVYGFWNTAQNPSIGIRGFNSAGSQLFDITTQGMDCRGWAQWVSVELQQIGTNVQWALLQEMIGFGQKYVTVNLGTIAGTLGNGTSIVAGAGGNLSGTTVGHVTYQNGAANQQDMSGGEYATIMNAMIGETAGARFQRLCQEQNIPARFRGQMADTQPMGPQTATDLISLLQECIDCERGMFWEPPWLGALGMIFQSGGLLNQQTPAIQIPYGGSVISAGSLQSTEDDQFTINDALVVSTYTGGQTEVAVTSGPLSTQAPPNGVGPAQQQPQINVASDYQTGDEAGWITWVGTAPDLRYPAIPIHMQRAAAAGAAFYNAVRELDVGDRLQITTPASAPADTAQPVWLPPTSQTAYARGGIDVLINQITSTLNTEKYDVGILGIPTTPYLVAIADDPVHGRVDSATSTLDAPMGTTDTLLAITNPVATPQLLWTLNEGAFPMDLGVGGEQVTAVSISGTPTSTSSDAANPPQATLAPSGVNSLLYGAVVNPTNATTFTADANTTFSANVADATNTKAYGTFRTTASPAQGPGTTTFGASAPAVSGRIAAVEVMCAGTGTIAEDASSPPSVSTLTAKTVTTAQFTPPPGSLLLLMIAANGSGSGFVSTSISIPYGSGHWRQLAIDGDGQATIMAFRVPANATGPISVTVTTSGTPSANGLLVTLKVLTSAAAGPAVEVMTVIRSQNGVVKPQVVGTPVALFATPAVSL